MATTLINSESDLINEIKRSAPYKRFQSQHFKIKVQREQKAWELLKANKGQYNREILENIFDIVDQEGGKSRWFGSLLGTPNRNLIFQSPIGQVSNWIDYVCFSGLDAEVILNNCLDQMKIKGASKGLATLLLYLSDPSKYAIWVNRTYEGLDIIDRMKEKKSGWGAKYAAFNANALEFAHVFSFDYRELDWVLSFIGSYVNSNDSHYEIDEDVLGSSTVPVAVSDEEDDDEIDDMVGEPMELGVMRWTPTNEMGVVALFIEYRRELGFPIVEFIRPQFPDAAVFEQDGKRYVRRYIEFEYRSKGYKSHLTSSRKCHYVVCWEHD
ncbi:MAG: hypothetical protein ABSG67_01760 [Thermoguttaceae bacterium]|jgi:hypothetical protein